MDNKGYRDFHCSAIVAAWKNIKRLRKGLSKVKKRVYKDPECKRARASAERVAVFGEYLALEESTMMVHYNLLPEVQEDVSLQSKEKAEQFATLLASNRRWVRFLKNQKEMEYEAA